MKKEKSKILSKFFLIPRPILCDGIASAGWAELLALCDDSVLPVSVPINCNGAENLDESATDHSMSTSLVQAPVAVAKQALAFGFGDGRHKCPVV